MSTATVREIVRKFGQDDPPSDSTLLVRFTRNRDHEAFEELLRRHGPVVLGVCRRLLANRHDAEDAFQAVFLVLARKADSVRPAGMVGNWLYGVAVRTANKAKLASARRWRREMATVMAPASRKSERPEDSLHRAELRAVIDQELGRLPEPLRAAVVLCDLGGKSRSEAARDLACPEGTIAARLHRARKLLAERFAKRGITLATAGLTAILTPEIATSAVPTELAHATLAAAEPFARGAASSAVSPTVEALAHGVIRTMTRSKLHLLLAAVLIAGLLTGGGILWGADRADDSASTAEPQPAKDAPGLRVLVPDSPPKPDPAPGYVTDVRFSPGGKLFAVVAGGTVTVSVTDFKPQQAGFGPALMTMPGEAVAFSADGTTLIVMGSKAVTSLDILTRVAKSFPRPKTNLGWHRVSFSPDGKRYAAHFGFNVRVYETETGFEPVRLDNQHEPGSAALPGITGRQLTWMANGKQLAAVGVLVGEGKMGAAGWDLESGKRFYAFEATSDGPHAAGFSPDSKAIAVAYKAHIDVWTGGLNRARGLDMSRGIPTALAFSPDGKTIAVGIRMPVYLGFWANPKVHHKSEVVVLDASTGKEVRRFVGFEEGKPTTALPITALAFSPDGKKLIAGTGIDRFEKPPEGAPKVGEVQVFSLDAAPAGPWREKAVLKDAEDSIVSVAFSPDGKTFSAGCALGLVSTWDATTHKNLYRFQHDDIRGRIPTAVAYSPDGRNLGLSVRGGVMVVDALTLKSVFTKDLPSGKGVVILDGATPLAIAFGPTEKVQGITLNRLAFTDGKTLVAKTWLDSGAPGTATFGPLAGAPKIDGTPPAGVAYSDDGKQLVFIPNYKVDPAQPIGKPDPVKATHWIAQVWGGGSGAAMALLPHGTEPVTAVAWSKDGKLIATGGAEGDVVLWDAKTFKEVKRIRIGGRNGRSRIDALAFAPDGKTLAAAVEFEDGKNAQRVRFLDLTTGETTQDLQPFLDAPPVAVAFSPDSQTLIVGCGYRGAGPRKLPLDDPKKIRGEVRVFSIDPPVVKPKPAAVLDAWKEKAVLTHHACPVDSVAFAPDGKSFVSGGADGKLLLWDAASLKPEELGAVIPAGKHTAVAFHPDGKLVAATRDKVTGFFDPTKRQTVLMNPPFPGGRGVAFSPDGKWVATSEGFRTEFRGLAEADAAAGGSGPGELAAHLTAPVAWSPDSRYLAHILPSADPNIDWRIGLMGATPDAKPPPQNLGGHKGPIAALAWSKDGKFLASGGSDGNVIVWDGKTFEERSRSKILGRNGASTIRALAFSPDGKTLAAGVELDAGKSSYRVVMIDPATGKEVEQLMTFSTPIRSLAFSPDGRLLLAACGIDRSLLKRVMAPDEMKASGAIVVWDRSSRE